MNLSWLNITSNFKMNANNISKPRNPNQNLYSIKQINYSAKEKKGTLYTFTPFLRVDSKRCIIPLR